MLFLLALIFIKAEFIREIVLSPFEDTSGERSSLQTQASRRDFFQSLGFAPCGPQQKCWDFRRAYGGWTPTKGVPAPRNQRPSRLKDTVVGLENEANRVHKTQERRFVCSWHHLELLTSVESPGREETSITMKMQAGGLEGLVWYKEDKEVDFFLHLEFAN